MEKMIRASGTGLVLLLAPFLATAATSLDTFYAPQFQCDENATVQATAPEPDRRPDPHHWTVIEDLKITPLPRNPKNKHPHLRFRQSYQGRARIDCGFRIPEAASYEAATLPATDSKRNAIILLYLENGKGVMTRLDYDTEQGNREDAHSYFIHETFNNMAVTCISRYEDLIAGRTKIDVDRICAGSSTEDKAKTQAQVDRLLVFWKKFEARKKLKR